MQAPSALVTLLRCDMLVNRIRLRRPRHGKPVKAADAELWQLLESQGRQRWRSIRFSALILLQYWRSQVLQSGLGNLWECKHHFQLDVGCW